MSKIKKKKNLSANNVEKTIKPTMFLTSTSVNNYFLKSLKKNKQNQYSHGHQNNFYDTHFKTEDVWFVIK